MCHFFSFCVNEQGRKYYFDSISRMKESEPDSHSRICEMFNLDEDKINKFEYNPITEVFKTDQINSNVDNSLRAEDWVRRVNFHKIEPLLIVQKIICPFKDFPDAKITDTDIQLLKEWNSVLDSVWNSVRNSVLDSVRDFVQDSVWNPVLSSVWNSVLSSVYAYYGSFFDIYDGEYKFDSANKLWRKGLVPVIVEKSLMLVNSSGVVYKEGK